MRSRKEILMVDSNLEEILISNFVRVCLNGGLKLNTAYEELEVRLEALNELKLDNKG